MNIHEFVQLFIEQRKDIEDLIKRRLRGHQVDLRKNVRGVLPGKYLPTTGNTGSGYTPAAHATSHKHGGADEVATATPGANAIPKAGGSGTIADGWLSAAIARLADLAAIYLALADVTTTPTASKVPRADGSGKLADGWLSANVPLKNAANTFTEEQTFDGGAIIKQSVPSGETLTIPSGYCMVVCGDYTVTGDLSVAGDLAIVG